LVRPELDRLAAILAEATSTPGTVWLLVWSGYGALEAVPRDAVVEVSRSLAGSGRTYLPFRGSFEEDAEPRDGPAFGAAPSLWWPADRAWFVATEIDSSSTYVGGTDGLIDRLLSDIQLEVLPADLDDPYDGSPFDPI
jgi:hypothetical protein